MCPGDHPEATVRWGEQTFDEMIVGYVEYYVPVENPRMKQVSPVTIGLVFTTLDKDQDGFLTLEEFRKLREVFRKNR